MLTIRLNRTGKRNRAYFRVVLQEHTKAPGKRHVEILGSVDPHKKTTILKKDRISYWLGQGVQTSDTVHNLFVREGIVEGKKIARKMPRPVKKEPAAAEAVSSEETKVEEAAPAAEAVVEAPVEEVKAEEVSPAETPTEEVKTEEKKEEVAA